MIGLGLWFYYQENRYISPIVRFVFLGAMLMYLFSILFADAGMQVKLFTVSRDFIVLASLVALLSAFRTKKSIFLALFIAAIGGVYFYYFPILQASFASSKPLTIIGNEDYTPLAEDAELLVELKEKNQLASLETVVKKYGLSLQAAFFPDDEAITELDDYYTINIPQKYADQWENILNALQNIPEVIWVESNEKIQIKPLPATTTNRGKRNYGINDPAINRLWAFEQMEMDQLYQLLQNKQLKPQKKALIAILDTGIDAKHEDIADNYQSIQKKYDKDANKHGTHCAGIAGAVSNNGVGIASFSPDNSFTRLASVQVLGSFGGGTEQGVIKGILEAADAGADVISMSLGARSTTRRQKAYEQAIAYANEKGAIVVAAAGNSNMNAKDYSPANTPGIITVSAVDERLNRASFSNYIQDVEMGIAAPGVNIYSTVPKNKYESFNGTSMATPYVAGLLGMMKSIRPDLTTKEAYKILKESGKHTKATTETGAFIQPASAIRLLLE